jgi:hypothetical protein
MKHFLLKNKFTIWGSGGGAKPQAAPPPNVNQYPNVLAPPQMGKMNSITSFSYAQMVDLLSEGPIEGIVNKFGQTVQDENLLEGIYFNETAVKESSIVSRHSIPINFLTKILKDFWNCSENLPPVEIPIGKQITRTVSNLEIDDPSFLQDSLNPITIKSFHPKDSLKAYIDRIGAPIDNLNILERAFESCPVKGERPFLTLINIPKMILNLPKTKFDKDEGGITGEYPIVMEIENLSNFVYFSIGSENFSNFNYFELPKSYVINNFITPAKKRTFQKTQDLNNKSATAEAFLKYQAVDINIILWSVYSDETGIKKIPEVLDRYFSKISVYQNTFSLYNYSLTSAEFRNGGIFQSPLNNFTNVHIDTEYNKDLQGPFKITNSWSPMSAFGPGGVQRVTSFNMDEVAPYNIAIENETSDDIRHIKNWPVEYTKRQDVYMINNAKPNYAVFDESSRNRSSQDATPITHIIKNPNVEEVNISLQINALYDTNHIDLVDSTIGDISSSKQNFSPFLPFGSPTYSELPGLSPIVGNSKKQAYFLVLKNTSNSLTTITSIIDGGKTVEDALYNLYQLHVDPEFNRLFIQNNFNYESIIKAKQYFSYLVNFTVPRIQNFTKRSSLNFEGFKNNLTSFQAILSSRNEKGEFLYDFALKSNEFLASVANQPNNLLFSEIDINDSYLSSISSTSGVFNYIKTIIDLNQLWQPFKYKLSLIQYDYNASNVITYNRNIPVIVLSSDVIDFDNVFNIRLSSIGDNDDIQTSSLKLKTNFTATKYPNIYEIIKPILLKIKEIETLNPLSSTIKKSILFDQFKKMILLGISFDFLEKNLYLNSDGKINNDTLEFLLANLWFKTSLSFAAQSSLENKYDDNISLNNLRAGLVKLDSKLIAENTNILNFQIASASDVNNRAIQEIASSTSQNPLTQSFVQNIIINNNPPTYNKDAIYLKNENYNLVSFSRDYILTYFLFNSSIDALTLNQNAFSTRYDFVDYCQNVKCGGGGAIAGKMQSITAGTRMPAVVSLRVDTGYEVNDEDFNVNFPNVSCYYSSCRYDIFGLSTETSIIDLGSSQLCYKNVSSYSMSPSKWMVSKDLFVQENFSSFSLIEAICSSSSKICTGYFLLNRPSIASSFSEVNKICFNSGSCRINYNEIGCIYSQDPAYNFCNLISTENLIFGSYNENNCLIGLEQVVPCREIIPCFWNGLKNNKNFQEISLTTLNCIFNKNTCQNSYTVVDTINFRDCFLEGRICCLADFNCCFFPYSATAESKSVFDKNPNQFDTYSYFDSAGGVYQNYCCASCKLQLKISNFIYENYCTTSDEIQINGSITSCAFDAYVPFWIAELPDGKFFMLNATYGDTTQEINCKTNENYSRIREGEYISNIPDLGILLNGFRTSLYGRDDKRKTSMTFNMTMGLDATNSYLFSSCGEQKRNPYIFKNGPDIGFWWRTQGDYNFYKKFTPGMITTFWRNKKGDPYVRYGPYSLVYNNDTKLSVGEKCIRYTIQNFQPASTTSFGLAVAAFNNLSKNGDIPTNINVTARNLNTIKIKSGKLYTSIGYITFHYGKLLIANNKNVELYDPGFLNKIYLPPAIKDKNGKYVDRFVKIQKLSHETLSPLISKKISVQKITEIIPQTFSYPYSSIIGLKLDSRSFGTIPNRTFDCKLKKVLVPTNYFPLNSEGSDIRYGSPLSAGKNQIYVDDWDGTFKLVWTNNPAWIMLDLLINKKYGLGNYIEAEQIDIWELYKIARWCDNVDIQGYYWGVPDGYGGIEPRHAFNAILQENYNVFDVISQVASVFRGHVYYMNSIITFDDDRIKPVIGEFNNSDVKEGLFSYTNLKKDDEFTALELAFQDERDGFKPKIEYVEDSDGIRVRGLLKKQLNDFGITSREQARRYAKYILFQTAKENLNVQFVTDARALLYKPGDLIKINDTLMNSNKNYGSIKDVTDIDSSCFSVLIDMAIAEDYISSNEISLHLPLAKPKYEDIKNKLEFIPKQVNFNAYQILNAYLRLGAKVSPLTSCVCMFPSQIRDSEDNYRFTGAFKSSIYTDINIPFELSYISNCNIKFENSKYGHWLLSTGNNSIGNNYFKFDAVVDEAIKYQAPHGRYIFEYFDTGCFYCYNKNETAQSFTLKCFDENGYPLYETLPKYNSYVLDKKFIEDLCFNVIEYKKARITYEDVIQNDRPSVESFEIVCVSGTGAFYETRLDLSREKINEYSCLILSKKDYVFGLNKESEIVQQSSEYRVKSSITKENGGIDNILIGSPYSLTLQTKESKIFKVMSISENYINEYDIFASQFNCEKFKEIEDCSSVDNLSSTFNFLYGYTSASQASQSNNFLTTPLINCLSLYKDQKENVYIQASWKAIPQNKDSINYKLYVQTPSSTTNNFLIDLTTCDLSKFCNNNLFNYNFLLPENSKREIGTYKFSIQAVYQCCLDAVLQPKQFSDCSSRTINIMNF